MKTYAQLDDNNNVIQTVDIEQKLYDMWKQTGNPKAKVYVPIIEPDLLGFNPEKHIVSHVGWELKNGCAKRIVTIDPIPEPPPSIEHGEIARIESALKNWAAQDSDSKDALLRSCLQLLIALSKRIFLL